MKYYFKFLPSKGNCNMLNYIIMTSNILKLKIDKDRNEFSPDYIGIDRL